jgi:hypothetical protein
LGNSIKSSKKVEVVESISIPLINQEFLFVSGVKNMKRLLTHFDKDRHDLVKEVFEGYDETPKTVDAYVEYYSKDDGTYYLAFVLRNINDKVYGTIVHEVVHIMQHIRKKFFLNKTEVEFEAYMTEWIFSEIVRLLKENQQIK